MSPIPEVFDLILRLGIRDGVAPLSKTHPGRCWERDLGSGWWIALNGNEAPVKCSRSVEVPPFTIYGERNGFPALLVNPKGGSVGGHQRPAGRRNGPWGACPRQPVVRSP